ncbi:hypothetical protein ED312_09815 [Sinomicrobium pectinilyticum]|uniref:Secreted protein n=1 Tax=Sinomicrobium pectinilyticum TaxID=1084421 RepID=A0A3N0EIU1_SINP1|nr:DUF6520 family protein [Sinomicrobium pectinilyticum]RNL87800.1 hypothetical protein ED312_09815 [Sinomicrobium pectinilyticum]
MKAKKFLAGSFILVFAVGSAIASSFQPERVHVRGKVYVNPEEWQCVPTNVFCDTEGSFECVVNILVSGVNTNVRGYKGPGACSPETYCILPLRRSTSEIVPAIPIKTIYEVRPWDVR